MLESLLQTVTSGTASTASLSAATVQLAAILAANDGFSRLLVVTLNPNSDHQVRQLAAIEARKLVRQAAAQNSLRQNQIRQVAGAASQSSNPLRHSLALLAAQMNLFADSCFNPHLPAMMADSNQSVREVALYILIESIDDASALPILATALLDSSREIAILAIQALGALAECIDDDDTFAIEIPLLALHFQEILQVFLQISSNAALCESTRVQSLSFIMWTLVTHREQIKQFGLVSDIQKVTMTIATENKPDDDCPAAVALQILNKTATLFPDITGVNLMQSIAFFLNNADANYRKSGVLAIAVTCEPCATQIEPHITSIIDAVLKSLVDPSNAVVDAACIALQALMECDFNEQVISNHATLIPALLGHVDGLNSSSALGALDSVLEIMGADISGYLHNCVRVLGQYLWSVDASIAVKAINCVGSAAHSAELLFTPCFCEIYPAIRRLCDHQNTEIKAAALTAAAGIAKSVGPNTFRECLLDLVQCSVSSFKSRDGEGAVVVAGIRVCGTLSRMYGNEFEPFLTGLVPILIQICRSRDDNEWKTAVVAEVDEDDEDSLCNADEERESAIETLAVIFVAMPRPCIIFLEEIKITALALLDNCSSGVRVAAAACLLKLVEGVCEITGSAVKWTPGVSEMGIVNSEVVKICSAASEGILNMISVDEEMYSKTYFRTVVTQVMIEMCETINSIGPVLISNSHGGDKMKYVDLLANQMLLILRNEHPCQNYDHGKDEEDEDDDGDSLLVAGACDFVATLATCLGASFTPYFNAFLPLIATRIESSSVTECGIFIGAIAECIAALETNVTPHFQTLFGIFMHGVSQNDEDVRSNSAYGIGILLQWAQIDLRSMYPQVLKLLSPLFNRMPNSPVSAHDNACGCISRMIIRNYDCVPVEEVVPVILAVLPLTDEKEMVPVVDMLQMLSAMPNIDVNLKLSIEARLSVLN